MSIYVSARLSRGMSTPFGSEDIAAGYATSRPPVHPRVLERVAKCLGWREPLPRALDVGCGAGVSTRALGAYARQCIGLEPAEAMLRWARATAPNAEFVAGGAEAIPLRGNSVDIITAAGSLNYADLDLFFPEAARVLRPHGDLVVYDFGPGIRCTEGTGLEEWFSRFVTRYPQPLGESRQVNPEVLARRVSGFQLHLQERFEVGVALARDSYLDYMLTETNVAAAMRGGAARAEIRSWCDETLAAVWKGGVREILFHGYFACLGPVTAAKDRLS